MPLLKLHLIWETLSGFHKCEKRFSPPLLPPLVVSIVCQLLSNCSVSQLFVTIITISSHTTLNYLLQFPRRTSNSQRGVCKLSQTILRVERDFVVKQFLMVCYILYYNYHTSFFSYWLVSAIYHNENSSLMVSFLFVLLYNSYDNSYHYEV